MFITWVGEKMSNFCGYDEAAVVERILTQRFTMMKYQHRD